ncbi:MAG: GIY-YIG nuclease family protein [Saprospiraceae bacterium]|nr:GIY-YIG nuclease family protein [Saprospiraceae bacterium]
MESKSISPGVFVFKVYILSCHDGSIYTGCTSNLDGRLERHYKGQVPSTSYRRPVKLLTYIAFPDKYRAFAFEKYLKSGSGRAFLKRHML